MTCRVECIRSDTELVALRTIGRGFNFLLTKNVLQLLHNFIFQLRTLIGMECLGWSEDTKYPFDKTKSFRNGLLFLGWKCDEHSKLREMIDDRQRVQV